jgi:AAA15 family ATPase/GTPase
MEEQIENSYLQNRRDYVPLDRLYLDPNNYRFIDSSDYTPVPETDITDIRVQQRTRKLIAGKNNNDIDDTIRSIKTNGFLDVDQIQVRQIQDNTYVVIEGNRRVTTLKFLKELYDSQSDIGRVDPAIFDNVPVVVTQDADKSHYQILMGLKHISGNKKWPAVNQAKLLKSLRDDSGLSEQQIRDMLGISTVQLRRFLRTLSLVEAYERSDYGEQFKTDMFNLFSETIKQPKIMSWLGWDDSTYQAQNLENLNRFFSWVSKEERNTDLDDINEDNEGITEMLEPIVIKGTDLRELGQIIDDPAAIERMEEARSISSALLSSDRFSVNKFEESLNFIDRNIMTAIDFSRFATEESKERIPDLKRKFDALLISRGFNDAFSGIENLQNNGDFIKSKRQREILEKFSGVGFSEIHIEKHKLLRGTKVKNLSRINLFAGENNAGKSTLLEAIYVLTTQNDVEMFADMQRRRGKFATEMPALWLNEQVDKETIVSGFFNGRKANVRLFKEEEEEDFNKASYLTTFFVEADYGGEDTKSQLRLFTNQGSQSFGASPTNLCRIRYSSPFSIHNSEDLFSAHEQTVKEKAMNEIIAFINQHVDVGIEKIEIVVENEFARFRVTHKDLGEAIDLTQFGDGIQRIFHIALQFAACKNGVLLIDEIENAIHHSLFKEFVKLIFLLSEQFKVQVFITSHSKECIDAFFENEDYGEHLSAYRLIREENGQVQCLYEEGKRYSRLIQNFGADLRG